MPKAARKSTRMPKPGDVKRMLRILFAKAALDRNLVVDHGQGGEQALAAVDADHLEAFADQAALVEIVEEALPFGA
jgi:hypothetical protein